MLVPKSEFDHHVVVLVRLLCSHLGIADITSAKPEAALNATDANATLYKRSYRKLRRRIMKLANAEALLQAPARVIPPLRKITSISSLHVQYYLIDVVCVLLNAQLDSSTMCPLFARVYSENTLRAHVNKTFKSKSSRFKLKM